ncbi:MAG: retropepsin-like aspartic protease family protein, partial [Zoogloea sp.]|uniref:retropepsin-like aspartic protease family protein n=1 Tax=Zoogloea sp. TaxID=49181 RepID=UPI003F2C7023
TQAQPASLQTANGVVQAWRVKLDTVQVGDVTLRNVDGIVHGADMPFVLLGMSFLNRMEMRRDGNTMVLRQRY